MLREKDVLLMISALVAPWIPIKDNDNISQQTS